jgi:Fe-S cluster biosynthesis and repair protein YggX
MVAVKPKLGVKFVSTIYCHFLKADAEALAKAPYPGPLGVRILAEISRPAWQQWLAHQTTLINENRLNPLDVKTRTYLAEQMQKFLFEGGADHATGFVAKT